MRPSIVQPLSYPFGAQLVEIAGQLMDHDAVITAFELGHTAGLNCFNIGFFQGSQIKGGDQIEFLVVVADNERIRIDRFWFGQSLLGYLIAVDLGNDVNVTEKCFRLLDDRDNTFGNKTGKIGFPTVLTRPELLVFFFIKG